MFQVGDLVIYGIHGVCRILSLEERVIDKKKIKYFALQPNDQPETRYFVPAENPVALSKLRHIIGQDELNELLASNEVREDNWVNDENQRKQYYREIINSGNRASLLRMINTLHRHKERQAQLGRKFHLCDENFLRDAEKLLNAEFSLVLNIEPHEVGKYIISEMNK